MYEEPSPFAYEPHTVFLLESRYDVQYGIGRKDHPAHIIAVCRTADFQEVIKLFNSSRPPLECLTFMDNARWPWLKPKSKPKKVKWWTSVEERDEALRQLGRPTVEGQKAVQDAFEHANKQSEEDDAKKEKDFRRHLAQTAGVAARVSEEQQLSDIATTIKPLQGKIPFELEFEDGTVAHPSGFVPPTPADRQHDPEYHLSPHPHSKVATELRRRQVETVDEHHSDSLVPRIEQWKALKERKDQEGGLMQSLTTGILSGGVSAATEPRDAKIPTEIHGIHDNAVAQPMQHPSGFVPPTARMSRGESDARTSIVEGENSDSGDAPEAPERSPTFASSDVKLEEEQRPVNPKSTRDKLRKTYFEFIKSEPFWRPLLCLSVSTRPIALTLARLARGLPQGNPFHSVVSPDDRKSVASYPGRLRSLRIMRMRTLATEMAQLLLGARGGLIGVRFDAQSRGRGIEGEGLDKPIPWDKRVIGVGIGEWCPQVDELVESFKLIADQEVTAKYDDQDGASGSPFLTYKVDALGVPVGEPPQFPWTNKDLKDERIKAGMDAYRIVRKMERSLARESGRSDGKTMSIIVPNYTSSGQMPWSKKKHHEWAMHEIQQLTGAVANPQTPIIIRDVGIGVEDHSIEHCELVGERARGSLKRRIANFYHENQANIALALAMGSPDVVYPDTNKNMGIHQEMEVYEGFNVERYVDLEVDNEEDIDDDDEES